MKRHLIAALPARKNRLLNPFQYLLYEALAANGYSAVEYEQAWAHWSQLRIVHLHWPDGAVFHRSLVKTLVRLFLFFILLAAYRFRGARVVWTAHNLTSHDYLHPRLERWFWSRLYRRLDAVISLKPLDSENALCGESALRGIPIAHIAHGEYASYYCRAGGMGNGFTRERRLAQPPKRFLVFGHIRPYKRVLAILDAFIRHPDPSASLQLVGRCVDEKLCQILSEKVAADPRVAFCNELVPDEAVATYFGSTDALVSASSGGSNSGVLHLAASFELPVVFLNGTATDWASPVSLEIPASWPELAKAHAEFFAQIAAERV